MLFVVIGMDKENSGELRAATRASHLEFLNNLGGNLKLAGPFLDEDANKIGSLLIIEADNLQKLEELLQQEPYVKAGLFKELSIKLWDYSCGAGFKS